MSRDADFHEAMMDLYRRAKAECGYNATRYLSMVTALGALETARRLLHASTVSDGYTTLWEKGRLDLSVEAVCLDPKWEDLFTDDERAIASRRLKDYGYLSVDPA